MQSCTLNEILTSQFKANNACRKYRLTHRQSQPVKNPRSTHQQPNPSQQQLIVASQNGTELTAGTEDKETEKEQIKNNKDESSKLHGDWLLVTRRKKQTNHLPTKILKPVTQKITNKFSVLYPLAHQNNSKATLVNKKLPPRPKTSEIARTNKGSTDPKRRRHDEPIILPTNNEPIIKSDPTPHKSFSHDPPLMNLPSAPPTQNVAPPPFLSHVTPHKSFSHDPHLMNLPSAPPTQNVAPPPFLSHVTAPNVHNAPNYNKDHNFDPTHILQAVRHTNKDQQEAHLAHATPNDDHDDDDFENCEIVHETPKHDEEDMVT
jgi:hypothetical protein